jgi:hypothetical protein
MCCDPPQNEFESANSPYGQSDSWQIPGNIFILSIFFVKVPNTGPPQQTTDKFPCRTPHVNPGPATIVANSISFGDSGIDPQQTTVPLTLFKPQL